MPFPANVYNVLIASPSDVPQERQVIADCLHSWNALNSKDTGKVLLPVMWESHSAPLMADRPQGVLNDQMVRSCDMLIGAFWTRLGSPTGQDVSGTVEEIRWFLRSKKPVMIYFSEAPINPNKIDLSQFQSLNHFKQEIMEKGIVGQYSDISDFERRLSSQISIIVKAMNVAPTVDAKTVKKANKEGEFVKEKVEDGPQHDIYLEVYTERSFIVRGNTIEWKDQLKDLGGSWIKPKIGDRAWCFSNKKVPEVAKLLGILPQLRS
jgi:hypothetical protein